MNRSLGGTEARTVIFHFTFSRTPPVLESEDHRYNLSSVIQGTTMTRYFTLERGEKVGGSIEKDN